MIKKCLNKLLENNKKFIFTTLPVPSRMSGQAFMVTGPRIAANYGS